MSLYVPNGFEQIHPSAEELWQGNADANLRDIDELGIDAQHYRMVGQRDVVDFVPGLDVRTIASSGFTACSGIMIQDKTTGTHTFGHLQPGVRSFEHHMGNRMVEEGDAVILLGDRSDPPDALWDIRAGKYGPLTKNIITFEAGSTCWAAVYHAMSGEVVIARRKPTQSILRYRVFR